jgi:hypothetical protein
MNKCAGVFAAVLVSLAVLLSFSIVQANALIANTDVSMDWNTFGMTVTGVTLNFTPQSSSVSPVDVVTDWTTPISYSAAGGSASADASAIAASSAVNYPLGSYGFAVYDFLADRLGTFTVSGTGSVTFSVWASIAQSMAVSGTAFGGTLGEAGLKLADGNGNIVNALFSNALDSNGVFAGSQLLSVSMDFSNANNLAGNFSAWVDSFTYASVPEPSTILLIGFGIAGLLGFGRTKSSTAE